MLHLLARNTTPIYQLISPVNASGGLPNSQNLCGQRQGIQPYSETRNGAALNMFNSLDLATLALLDVIKTYNCVWYTIQSHYRSRKL